jgi:[phosphatase 2A protein]-leucine-carboxy methyltransferase
MSARDIPDLRTLLGARRGGPVRGGARGRGKSPGSLSTWPGAAADDAVRNTDQDAAGSRVSCVELGYLHDPYAELFASQPATRRLPLLNRGAALPIV